MATKRAATVTPYENTFARDFAGVWGKDRKGARIRSVILNPAGTGIRKADDEPMRYPLIEMGIGGGGQGGEVRLKLWLSLLYRTIKTEDWIKLRSSEHAMYAQMFGLEDPHGKGADRIRAAYRWLHANRFIVIDGGRLKPFGKVRVAHEVVQFLPAEFPMVLRPSPSGTKDVELEQHPNLRHRYFSVPRGLWENGWIAHLRASELLVLMILCDAVRGKTGTTIEIPDHSRLESYGLTDDMWRQGSSGLERRGIIVQRPKKGRIQVESTWRFTPDSARVFEFTAPTAEEALARPYDAALQPAIRSEIVQ